MAEWDARPDELIDACAYWFNFDAAQVGLDTWRLIEGIDAHINGGAFDVIFVNGTFKTVTGEQMIYIPAKLYEVLQCGK